MFRRRQTECEDVLVYMTGDRGALILARSLLDSAQIPYAVTSDLADDLFGWGRLGTAYNFVTGPARVFVSRRNADAAREILREIGKPTTPLRPVWLRVLVWLTLLTAAAQLLYFSIQGLVVLARQLVARGR